MQRTSRAAVAVRVLLAVCAVLLVTISVGADYPKPSAVARHWELDFRSGPLRLYVDKETGGSYWYFTYYVENNTGRDRFWAPELTLFTDDGRIMKSGEGVDRGVNEAILDFLGNDLLQSQVDVLGDLREGEENAKEGLAIWPARDLGVTDMSLFIAGLSGETIRMTNPMTGRQFIMRKTLHREYKVPGNAAPRGSAPVTLESERWILR